MSGRPRLSLIGVVFAFLAALALIAALAAWWGYGKGQATTRITDTGPTIIRLEKLSELVTVKVHVADVLVAENTSWAGDIKGAWLIKGDALLSVDMKLAKVLRSDEAAKKLTVQLPQPHVLQARVDHTRTVLYDWRKGLLRSQDVADTIWKDAMRHAQELVQQLAGEPDQLDMSRRQAEAALKQFYSYVGWNLDVVWEGQGPSAATQAVPTIAE
jgi:hypothetical protein